jgi:hypothetical protein
VGSLGLIALGILLAVVVGLFAVDVSMHGWDSISMGDSVLFAFLLAGISVFVL